MILDSASISVKMDEVTIGMVVGKLGNPGPMSRRHGNYFIHDLDRPIIDSITNTAVYEEQKPLLLLEEIIELFSSVGDWTFCGPSGLGMYMQTSMPQPCAHGFLKLILATLYVFGMSIHNVFVF